MSVGSLVRFRGEKTGPIGVVLEIKLSPEASKDYRTDDAALVVWDDGYEWVWISTLEMVNEPT